MKVVDIVILSDQNNTTEFSASGEKNLGYLEDHILKTELENEDLHVLQLSWDDPDFDWSSARALIFRSTWDYFYRFQEFFSWLESVSQKCILINSEALIHWNLDKHYLNDLEKADVRIADSVFIEKETKTSLQQLFRELGCQEVVIKPCISGTARHTYRMNASTLDHFEPIFQQLIAEEAMILQPFQYDIVEKGEVSMMLIDGQFTHAVLKTAKAGDFRVQDDFGGNVATYSPS
ncbi:MAG: hypothetical protein HKN09_06225, partial [Saprospiraceae bacterium]|nr:hypothetical protein [Saprospiraceae bacterium]